ncbi:hypothetical protein J2741_000365 [Methanolinea mesophila]|nr:hypothetical protein [Methanolinea mesophila]
MNYQQRADMAWDEFKHGIRSPETSIAIFEDILCDIAHEYGHTEVVEYFKTIRTACWHQKKSSRF